MRDDRDNDIEALEESEYRLARTAAAFREQVSVVLELLHQEQRDNDRLRAVLVSGPRRRTTGRNRRSSWRSGS